MDNRVSLLVREEERVEHDKKLTRVEGEMSEVFKRKVRENNVKHGLNLFSSG